MKKLIYGSLFLAVVGIGVMGLSSCKKETLEDNIVENKTVTPSEQSDILWKEGRTYHWNGSKYILVDYYMRTLKDAWYGYGCFWPSGNCLPTAEASGLRPTEHTDVYHEFSQENQEQITSNYSTPLTNALGNSSEIKDFFNDEMVPNTVFPSQLVDDFNNDVITIKQFSEGLFIVNMNATSYDDCPVYDW